MARSVTLFTGQLADLPLTELAPLAQKMGFDGLELACWGDHFDVPGAVESKEYCQEHWRILTNFGDYRRYWDLCSIGDGDINFEDIIVALNDIGYRGPLSIEWAEIRTDRVHGATESRQNVKNYDSPRVGSPSIPRLSGINSNSQEVSFLCSV